MNEDLARIAIQTPVGTFECIATDEAVVALRPLGKGVATGAAKSAVLARAKAELEAYFAGREEPFAVPIAPVGTDFQKAVWRELRKIPRGEVTTYGDIARRIGCPTASRAVGRANALNPIAIIVPCHRVIGANGKLTGYAFGIDMKAWLLEHERAGTSLNESRGRSPNARRHPITAESPFPVT